MIMLRGDYMEVLLVSLSIVSATVGVAWMGFGLRVLFTAEHSAEVAGVIKITSKRTGMAVFLAGTIVLSFSLMVLRLVS